MVPPGMASKDRFKGFCAPLSCNFPTFSFCIFLLEPASTTESWHDRFYRLCWRSMDVCQEYLPQPALRPFVESIWHTPPIANSRFEIIPDGCVDVCFVLSHSSPRTLL